MHSPLLRGLRGRAHSPTLSKKGRTRPDCCPFSCATLPPVMIRIWSFGEKTMPVMPLDSDDIITMHGMPGFYKFQPVIGSHPEECNVL